MFKIGVTFRDEDGEIRIGELVNSFRIMIEGTEQVVHIDQPNETDIDVVTYDSETLEMHRIPSLAIVKMKEVALA